MKVLVFLDYFTPAYKAGGPIRIFEALAGGANAANQVSIVTQNVDWSDPHPLPVPEGEWTSFSKARVLYLSTEHRGFGRIRSTVLETAPDAIHLNSLFSRTWTMKILFLHRAGLLRTKVFLSPHGELAESALKIKPGRKRVFLALAKILGLFRRIDWIATAPKEVDEIRAIAGARASVAMVPPPLPPVFPRSSTNKAPGRLRLVFLARLSAMKNIRYLLEFLPAVRGDVELDIYGPVDPDFAAEWADILVKLERLSPAVRARYCGPIPSTETRKVLSAYHLFVQPSLSENFGYSIVEALASGTPVLISDRTPWNEVNGEKIGAALSLERAEEWKKTLQDFIDMGDAEWADRSRKAQEWVRKKNTSAEALFKAYETSATSRSI